MPISLSNIRNRLRLTLTTLAVILSINVPGWNAKALSVNNYASESRLATGRWVKISVAETGIHVLTPTALKQMGFGNPDAVRVFGYGGKRLPERLDATFIDDLPEVPTLRSGGNILFYAVGTLSWTGSAPMPNPFTTLGYYFITDSVEGEGAQISQANNTSAGATNPTSIFADRVWHKLEQVSPGQTGHLLVGESFIDTPQKSFKFTLPGRADGPATLYASFVAKSSAASFVYYSVDGVELASASSDRMIPLTDGHAHYNEALSTKTIEEPGDNITIGVRYQYSARPSLASLNYLVIIYRRHLALEGGVLQFETSNREVGVSGADASTVVWDVTDALNIKRVNTALDGGKVTWTATSGTRRYVAFNPSATFTAPKYVGVVQNQNIHGLEVPDMVIFTPREFVEQAERLAKRRREGPDSLNVVVIDQAQAFNEFGSGAADVQALRKVLKMFYDRSTPNRRLKYALLFGRSIFDNRNITSAAQALRYPRLPLWQTDRGNSDSDSYSTDDIFAFLEDGSGTSLSSDKYCIGVGRLPVTSADDARNAIDKIIAYEESMPRTNWRNHALLVADDEDAGIHLIQTERMWEQMTDSEGGNDILFTKLYIDQYPREGNVAKLAHDKLIRRLEEGVSWLTYIGHANTTSWSHESLLTYQDINNLHLRQYPILYAATCEFLRWDGLTISAAEIMWKLSGGGAISIISANRPVYISDNGPLSAAFGRFIFKRDDNGRRMSLGDIYKSAKNDYRIFNDKTNQYSSTVSANSNKLRYGLLGDPSMRPVVPDDRVVIDTINDIAVDGGSNDQAVIMASQDARVTGHIERPDGTTDDSFNGTINLTLYDADMSVTTLGLGEEGVKKVFEQHGDRLYDGYHAVQQGRFDITIPMPSEIVNNFREATMSVYAYTKDYNDAAGLERDFYVFGSDYTAESDTIAPVIHSFYLNHESFVDGSIVNPAPIAIAEISDNRALNMSSAGIGHQMTLKLNDSKTYTDVSQYFNVAVDGSPSGTIAYPLADLPEGAHSLRLRIWDAAGNSASQTLTFIVDADQTPTLYDVYTDVNPASTEVNFYLTHDRPESMIDVKISVYNLVGKEVWSTTKSGRSDMLRSFPINWKLTDNAGRRIGRGIYLYRASVVSEGMTSESITHKLAVTAE